MTSLRGLPRLPLSAPQQLSIGHWGRRWGQGHQAGEDQIYFSWSAEGKFHILLWQHILAVIVLRIVSRILKYLVLYHPFPSGYSFIMFNEDFSCFCVVIACKIELPPYGITQLHYCKTGWLYLNERRGQDRYDGVKVSLYRKWSRENKISSC